MSFLVRILVTWAGVCTGSGACITAHVRLHLGNLGRGLHWKWSVHHSTCASSPLLGDAKLFSSVSLWVVVKHCCESTSFPTFNISLFKSLCVSCEMPFFPPFLFFCCAILILGSSLHILNTNYLLLYCRYLLLVYVTFISLFVVSFDKQNFWYKVDGFISHLLYVLYFFS